MEERTAVVLWTVPAISYRINQNLGNLDKTLAQLYQPSFVFILFPEKHERSW